MDFKNKKALVSGVAKSGISAARLLKKLGAKLQYKMLKQRTSLEMLYLNLNQRVLIYF